MKSPKSKVQSPKSATTEAGFTLIEVLVALTISGMVALGAMTAARIGLRAWEKQQRAVRELRRATIVEDILQLQLTNQRTRQAMVVLPNRRLQMAFFFGDSQRLIFLSSYSARERGRGGIVIADYFAARRNDGLCDLWLDERPALDDAQLGEVIEDVTMTPEGFRAIVRPFAREGALLMWEGLRDCGFQYRPNTRRNTPQAAEWVAEWVGGAVLPAAIGVRLAADPASTRGLAPVAVVAPLPLGGIR